MELPLLIFLGLIGIAVVGGAAASAVFADKRFEHVEVAWSEYAAARGYAFQPGGGRWPKWRSPGVLGRVKDVDVTIAACLLRIKDEPVPCTRVSGRALEPLEMYVCAQSNDRIRARDVFHALPDAPTGDASFDRAIETRASVDPRDVLSEGVRRELEGFLTAVMGEGVVLEYEAGDVSLTWRGVETSAKVLDLACGVVATACRVLKRGVPFR